MYELTITKNGELVVIFHISHEHLNECVWRHRDAGYGVRVDYIG